MNTFGTHMLLSVRARTLMTRGMVERDRLTLREAESKREESIQPVYTVLQLRLTRVVPLRLTTNHAACSSAQCSSSSGRCALDCNANAICEWACASPKSLCLDASRRRSQPHSDASSPTGPQSSAPARTRSGAGCCAAGSRRPTRMEWRNSTAQARRKALARSAAQVSSSGICARARLLTPDWNTLAATTSLSLLARLRCSISSLGTVGHRLSTISSLTVHYARFEQSNKYAINTADGKVVGYILEEPRSVVLVTTRI